MIRTSKTLGIVILQLMLTSAAVAQTTGTIRGQIRDAEGSPLPGVTVTATTVGRGTARMVISGESGAYALTSMPVATYVVSAVLDGFQEQKRDDVRVGLGASATIDLVMRPLTTVEEAILVTGSPVVDTSSSSVSTNYDAEFAEALPTTRNFFDLMAVAPGVSQQQSDESWKLSVFGSSIASNSWSVDGQETTSTDSGQAFWWVNPDTVEEIQVLAIGAPAQYGNMSGAAMNVVTKSGTNEFKADINYRYMDDSMTGENAHVNGVGFRRDEFLDLSATAGGPIIRDKAWFFAAYQKSRDAWTAAGDPSTLPTEIFSDKYDLKINWAVTDGIMLQAKYHQDDWPWAFSHPFRTDSASETEGDDNPAWSINLDAVLSANTFLEFGYSGYTGIDIAASRTGSTEDPFIDYSPPEGGPPRFSGGLYYPWNWDANRDAADVAVSTYAEDFLGGDHEFKFGVSYGSGAANTQIGAGINGRYYYRYVYTYTYEYNGTQYSNDYEYFYRTTVDAYWYGAESTTISAYVDDSFRVNDKLTVNVGLRYDKNNADIPDYPRLDRFWNETGEIIPGIDDVVEWNHISPRIGFAYKVGESGVLRGFYGKFYDGNVTSNWFAPGPSPPTFVYETSTSPDGPWDPYYTFDYGEYIVDPNLAPPETDQFTFGYEHQLSPNTSLTFQGVYKQTKNLIGWEILGDGVYEMVPWTDPITGETLQLVNIIVEPTRRKGNRPGDGSLAPPGQKYEQDYKGAFLVFNKRYSNGWSMMASYTWSDSNGFLPAPQAQSQGNFFGTLQVGRDPNHWINANQALQNDRTHALQVQGNFDLPWGMLGTVVYRYLSGKPFNRQVQVGGFASQISLNQGGQTVIAVPATDDTRFSDQNLLDLSLGRGFEAGKATIRLDLQLFNVFNDDAHDGWETLVVAPGDEYFPSHYVLPRRWMFRLGVGF